MSFFTAKKDKETLEQKTGSAYINESGCYPVNVIAPFANTSKNGSTAIDFFIEHAGQQQVIYGNLRISNNDGSENTIGTHRFG